MIPSLVTIAAHHAALRGADEIDQAAHLGHRAVLVHHLLERVLAQELGVENGAEGCAQGGDDLGAEAAALEAEGVDPDQARAVGYDIFRKLGGNYRVYDWQQSNSAFFGAVEVERNVMFIILSLIILVAAFNIISSMIMLVKDKTGDIAILRTMGATRGMILRIFMLSGASIGVVGTILGFLLGIAFTTHIEQIREFVQSIIGVNLFNAEIYFLTQIPARIDPHEVAMVLAMAFGLSFLATVYPSWRAARLDPVEALRYE
jgi:lipoprotein-releasing system permease protein